MFINRNIMKTETTLDSLSLDKAADLFIHLNSIEGAFDFASVISTEPKDDLLTHLGDMLVDHVRARRQHPINRAIDECKEKMVREIMERDHIS